MVYLHMHTVLHERGQGGVGGWCYMGAVTDERRKRPSSVQLCCCHKDSKQTYSRNKYIVLMFLYLHVLSLKAIICVTLLTKFYLYIIVHGSFIVVNAFAVVFLHLSISAFKMCH